MRTLSRKLWSHTSLATAKKQYVRVVRASRPTPISHYTDLVIAVARISYHNRHSSLFFRGQGQDHREPVIGTSILPEIYRELPARGKGDEELTARFQRLKAAEELLEAAFKKHDLEADSTLSDYHVVKWAILQHYDVCPTPLLDITTSLRAACSFAFEGTHSAPILLVLGFPHVNGSISFYVEEELVTLNLLSICPPNALRPHFQEGYLVGSLPADYGRPLTPSLDVGRRLVAKFALATEGFWDTDFRPIPHDALFPRNDIVDRICQDIASQIQQVRPTTR
jgi:hypothetical protein